MHPTQIALNTVSTAHPSFEEALKAFADAGFKNIEFVIPQIKKYMQEKKKSVADVKALLGEYGLRSVGGFEATICAFGSDADKAKNRELLIGNAKLLAELGGGVMVMGTDGPAAGTPVQGVEALKAAGRAMAELADLCPASVTLAVEFNWSPIVKSVRSAEIVVDAANHDRVGILFDPAHYHCTNSKLEDLTAKVVRKIAHVHVDDMRNKPGEHSNCNSDRVLPGDGTLDLKQLFGRLEEHGYKGLFSIEMFNDELWKLPVQEAAKRCYAAMEKTVLNS